MYLSQEDMVPEMDELFKRELYLVTPAAEPVYPSAWAVQT